MIVMGIVDVQVAFTELIYWNVVALFTGTLILAELFMLSGMPAVLAEIVVDRMGSSRGAILAICLLSSFLSIFIENVAVVLLLAPVAFTLCERLDVSPVKPLIFMAMFSNLQGTATLIGDPPSMILGGYLRMNFNDFFIYQGKPSIFFIIQAGALAALAYTGWLLRNWTQSIVLLKVEKPRSWIPSFLLIVFILVLSCASSVDPEFRWMAGTVAMGLALIGLLWHRLGPHWMCTRRLLIQLDWETPFFLMALFILVGALHQVSIIDLFSVWIVNSMGESLVLVYLGIIFFSVVVSAVVDNVPYILTMIPVVQHVSEAIGAPLPLLVFGLLVGSCLGGNITPIGACANIVAVGLLEKKGHRVTFWEYTRLGLPYTMVAVSVASLVLWLVWGG